MTKEGPISFPLILRAPLRVAAKRYSDSIFVLRHSFVSRISSLGIRHFGLGDTLKSDDPFFFFSGDGNSSKDVFDVGRVLFFHVDCRMGTLVSVVSVISVTISAVQT